MTVPLVVLTSACPPTENCVTSADCAHDRICVDGTCREMCQTRADCPTDLNCLLGACVPDDMRDAAVVDVVIDAARDRGNPQSDANGADQADDSGPVPDLFSGADLAGGVDRALPTGTEFLLFDGDDQQFTVADRGFHVLISPGDPLPVDNWSEPVDYYSGTFHIRYIINGPADQAAGKIQVCIWTMGNEDGDNHNYFPESCSDQVAHTGIGTYQNTRLVPSGWWKLSGVPLVFAHPERFLIRTVLRGPDGCNVTNYDVDGSCWGLMSQYENMNFRVTIVMVEPDDVFSGWSNYP